MSQDAQKKAAAIAAVAMVQKGSIIGVGTGSTTNYFIDALADIRHDIEGAVASSEASAAKLKALGIPVLDLNSVHDLPLYVDVADEINELMQMTKGGGAALTHEKIIAAVARTFVCIADASKRVHRLGKFPVPVEVLPMARSYVARQLVGLGGQPSWRQGVTTDNGNMILDVSGWDIAEATDLEKKINNITGVVTNGLFAQRAADILLLGTEQGVQQYNNTFKIHP